MHGRLTAAVYSTTKRGSRSSRRGCGKVTGWWTRGLVRATVETAPFFEEVQHRGADPARDLGPSRMPGLPCANGEPGGAQAMAFQARP